MKTAWFRNVSRDTGWAIALAWVYFGITVGICNGDAWAETMVVYLAESKQHFVFLGPGGYFDGGPKILAYAYNHLPSLANVPYAYIARFFSAGFGAVAVGAVYLQARNLFSPGPAVLLTAVAIMAGVHPSASSIISISVLGYVPFVLFCVAHMERRLRAPAPDIPPRLVEPPIGLLLVSLICKPSFVSLPIFFVYLVLLRRRAKAVVIGMLAFAQLYLVARYGPGAHLTVGDSVSTASLLVLATVTAAGAALLSTPVFFFEAGRDGMLPFFALVIGCGLAGWLVAHVFSTSQAGWARKTGIFLFHALIIFFSVFPEFEYFFQKKYDSLGNGELVEVLRSAFFGATWKYKLQYNILSSPVVWAMALLLVTRSAMPRRVRQAMLMLGTAMIGSGAAAAAYSGHWATVSADLDIRVALDRAGYEACYYVPPFPDWIRQLSAEVGWSNWTVGQCDRIWLKRYFGPSGFVGPADPALVAAKIAATGPVVEMVTYQLAAGPDIVYRSETHWWNALLHRRVFLPENLCLDTHGGHVDDGKNGTRIAGPTATGIVYLQTLVTRDTVERQLRDDAFLMDCATHAPANAARTNAVLLFPTKR